MSSVVKTLTPFLNKDLLLKALDEVGCKYTVKGNEIITDRKDYYGMQKFLLGKNGRYAFFADSSSNDMIYGPHYPWGNIDKNNLKTVSSFLNSVEKSYNSIHKRQLEEIEKRRLAAIAEQERLKREQEKALEEKVKLENERLIEAVKAEQKKIEDERRRIENERKAYVEKQKVAIIEKAKEQGYDVREEKVEEKVKLVLVRTTY